MRYPFTRILLWGLLLLSLGGCRPQATSQAAKPPLLAPYPATASLPPGLKWETNNDLPFSNPNAPKGGVFRTAISSYPLTFRLFGPNSNAGGFVGYNRSFTMWGLTSIHPNTGKVMPLLATHWAVGPDNKTVFYRLDRDARWSDGHPLTADDYLFGYEFMQSEHAQEPFNLQYARDHFASVEKVDDYTLKLVSVQPSWRILLELDITPLPRHETLLDATWVKRTNWKPNLTPGPYALKHFQKGKRVTFVRNPAWWGYTKPRFQGLFNFDKVQIDVISNDQTEFELFKKGKLELFDVSDSTRWVKQTDFEGVTQGWVHKQKIIIDSPAGMRGIFFNLLDPVLQEVKIRKALQHCLDFASISDKFLYHLEVRQEQFFDVFPPYRNPLARQPGFDLARANQLLDQAGWAERNEEGIRTKGGQPLKLVISTGSENWIKFLSFYKETALKAGIQIEIKLLDGAALYKSFTERSYQALVVTFGGGRHPSPRQFLHSENLAKGTNNLFQFSDPQVDRLIEVYEFDMNEQKRIQAINEIEKIVMDQAVMVQFWRRDHERLLWWRWLKGPAGFASRTGVELDALWIDPQEMQTTLKARALESPLPRLPLEADPHGIRTPSKGQP